MSFSHLFDRWEFEAKKTNFLAMVNMTWEQLGECSSSQLRDLIHVKCIDEAVIGIPETDLLGAKHRAKIVLKYR